MNSVCFTVYGIARPAGSKKAFYNAKLGRSMVVDANDNSRPWKALVSDAAIEATGAGSLLTGPLELVVRFYMPRPKGHQGARGLRPSAPTHPAVKPDTTKLLRAVEDALAGLVYKDDAQIVEQHVFKAYGEPARCEIGVFEINAQAVTREPSAARASAPIQSALEMEVA